MAHVTIIPHYKTPGWSGDLALLESGEVAYHPTQDLTDALDARYPDAPLMQLGVLRDKESLEIMPGQPRLTKNKQVAATLEALGLEVIFECIVFDVDCVVKATNGVAPDAWRKHQYRLLQKVPDGYGLYETPGGYRLFWLLPSAFRIPEFEALWKNLHAHLSRLLEVDGETAVDEKCKDWTRLYYLPKVSKPGFGDLYLDSDYEEMGVLNWEPGGLFGSIDFAALRRSGFQLPEQVPDGSRNDTLFKYAASLRARGGDEETIREKVTLANEERCHPPLEPHEVDTIVQSVVTRYDAPDPASAMRDPAPSRNVNPADTFYSPPGERVSADVVSGDLPVLKLGDEAELAELLLQQFEENNVACVVSRGEIHHYNRLLGYWEAIPNDTLLAVVQRFSGIPVDSGTDKEGMPRTRPLKVSLSSAKGAATFAYAMRNQGLSDFFDHRTPGVVFRNGFLRIDKGEPLLVTPDPIYRSDVFLDFDYVPNAQPKQFIQFLRELFVCDPDCEDKVRLLREFFGAALSGQVTRYAKALMLLGDGSNGKSTLLQIIEALYPQKLRASVLPHEMSRSFSRASLAGKVINIVTEMSKQSILDSEGFKALVAGDQIQAEFKHGQPFVFRPTAAHVFAANTLPTVSDSSEGFWRRWLVVEFNRTFTKADAKPGLAEEIIEEELGLIASWLIDAAASVWKRRYFSETDELAARRRAWRGESDAIQQFLLDMLSEPNAGFGRMPDAEDQPDELFVENAALYQKYRTWAELAGLKARSKVNLSKELVRLGIPKTKSGGKRGFRIPTDIEKTLH